jgi:hypothetical protein
VIVAHTDLFGEQGDGLPESFAYDAPRPVMPESRRWRKVHRVSVNLNESRGIAAVAGKLHVVGDEALLVYDELTSSPRIEPLDFEPTALASDGDVLLAVSTDGFWRSLDGGATWTLVVTGGAGAHFTSVTPNPSGAYVADAGNKVILEFSTDGEIVRRMGRKDAETNVPGLVVPGPHLEVALGPDGLVRVTNPGRRRIELYTPDGQLELAWGESGNETEQFCGCCNPTDLAVLNDGSVVTGEKGIPRVKVYSPTGEFLDLLAGPETFDPKGNGIDLAVSGGRVYALDRTRNVVVVFERVLDE